MRKKKLADKTLKRLEKGADFAEIAKEVSEDQRTQRRGGVTGFFSRAGVQNCTVKNLKTLRLA